MKANLQTLVPVARAHGEAKSVSWRAELARDRSVLVYHDTYVLMRVWPDNRIDLLGNINRTRADRRGAAAILLSVGSSIADTKES